MQYDAQQHLTVYKTLPSSLPVFYEALLFHFADEKTEAQAHLQVPKGNRQD